MTTPKHTQSKPPQKALIYCRTATAKQNGIDPIKGQLDYCRAYASDLGCEVVYIFSDHGLSGAPLDRPGIQALLDHIRKNPEECYDVIVADLSRIARSRRETEAFDAILEQHGAKLISPKTSSPKVPELAFSSNMMRALQDLERRALEEGAV